MIRRTLTVPEANSSGREDKLSKPNVLIFSISKLRVNLSLVFNEMHKCAHLSGKDRVQ